MATITRTTVGTLNGITETSRDFFFSSSGTNSSSENTGTAASPWLDMRNINNVTNQLSAIEPGDRFLFKAGETINHGSQYVPGSLPSGSEGAPIVFGVWENNAYASSPSSRAIVSRNFKTDRNSSFLASAAYTNSPIYYYPCTLSGANERSLWENGTWLHHAPALSDLLAAADGGSYNGTFDWWYGALHASDGGATGVYWRPTSGTTKASELVWIADGSWGGNIFSYSLTSDLMYHTYENLELVHSGSAIYYSNASYCPRNITIRNCVFHDNNNPAMQIYSGSSSTTSDINIYDCEVYNQGTGFSVFTTNGNLTYTHTRVNIYNNNLHDLNPNNAAQNAQIAIGGALDTEAIGLQNLIDSNVYKNTIYNIGLVGSSTVSANCGIACWNHASVTPSGNSIYRNYVYNCEEGIISPQTNTAAGTTTNNKIYDNIVHSCASIGIKCSMVGTTNIVHRNTVYNCFANFVLQTNATQVIKNNLSLSPTDAHIVQITDASVGSSVNYNSYYGGAADDYRHSADSTHPFAGTDVNNATWIGLSGTPDVDSLTSDPLLADPTPTAIDEFKPQEASPLRNSGDSVDTSTELQDYFGNYEVGDAPTIGAVSYIPSNTTRRYL